MCGICGLAGLEGASRFDEDLVRRMTDVLAHRGPDDAGVYLRSFRGPRGEGRIGLGHRRLSIIDLAGGHQPLANEDDSVWVVFNGEIYNFPELRQRLEASGHVFRTRCDTETLVHLYEDLGTQCVRELRGMFAFALWDSNTRTLLLARDRLGQKPLSYLREPDRILFASEIKSILQAPDVPRRLRLESLHDYLTYQYVPHPRTMFEGIMKLSPGHLLTWRDGEISIEEYWRPPFRRTRPKPPAEYVDEVRHLLTEATRMRLMSDVPLGAFLSGGIDSSIVVALMARQMSEPVKTFSIGFEEARYDELNYARQVAERYATDHHEFIVRPNAVEVIPELVWHYDEPFADSSAIPTYYVARETRRHVTVALTGDAGDEGFAGYPRYKAVMASRLFDMLPAFGRRFLAEDLWKWIPVSVESKTLRRRARRFFEAMCLSPQARYMRWCCIFDDARKLDLYSPEMRARFESLPSSRIFEAEYAQVPNLDFLARTLFVDYRRYLPDDLNTKVDVASMIHSLECRAPFLDHKVVEFAATVPSEFKLRRNVSKYLLKRAFGDLLPRDITRRGKMGFGVPIAEWFRGDLKNYIRDILLDPATLARGYFDPANVRHLVSEHTEGRFDHGYRLWALLMFELWHRRFLDAVPRP